MISLAEYERLEDKNDHFKELLEQSSSENNKLKDKMLTLEATNQQLTLALGELERQQQLSSSSPANPIPNDLPSGSLEIQEETK